jgi:hypothetical protein
MDVFQHGLRNDAKGFAPDVSQDPNSCKTGDQESRMMR